MSDTERNAPVRGITHPHQHLGEISTGGESDDLAGTIPTDVPGSTAPNTTAPNATTADGDATAGDALAVREAIAVPEDTAVGQDTTDPAGMAGMAVMAGVPTAPVAPPSATSAAPAARAPVAGQRTAVGAGPGGGRRHEAFPLWQAQQLQIGRGQDGTTSQSRRVSTAGSRPRRIRGPVPGLVAILLLGLLAGFFAWVSAEPLLLALGHAGPGTATVTGCTGSGIGRRCTVSFQGSGGSFTVARATLVGGTRAQEQPGMTVAAQMVSSHGRIAYAGGAAGLRLRGINLALVLLCGFAIAWASGATRLPTRRGRSIAIAASVLGPMLLLAGMLIAAW